jgi:hypothetical protein
MSGTLDATQAAAAQSYLDRLDGVVTLDCSGLQYLSSAGLGVLPQDAQAAARRRRPAAPDRGQPPPPGHLQLFGLRPDPRDRTRSLMRSPTSVAVACTSEEDDDRLLVERYLSGDREAFTALVVRYQRAVYNAAFWILRKHEDANDISQTVFLKVAERAADYDPRYKFFSWIYRIAVNESLNLQRRHRHEDELDDDVESPATRAPAPSGRRAPPSCRATCAAP